MMLPGEHGILFYLLVLALLAGTGFSVVVGVMYFFKRSGVRLANYFFGFLLIAIGLTLLHNIFVITAFYDLRPRWRFLPIYFTLAFPPLLFYYVKLNLYPSYRLRPTDIKHFILPAGQFLFFTILFFSPLAYKSQIDRYFYNPFYGAFEQFLYLSTFFAYMYFAYRYVIEKRHTIKKPIEARRILYLAKLIEVLFFLFCIHTIFVIADFVAYEFLNINLRTLKLYAAMGALSFAALVFWLTTYGIQVLIWGRRVFVK